MENQLIPTKLNDASREVPSIVDWTRLEASGLVRYYQGDPVRGDRYTLPSLNPKSIAPVAGLGVCLVRFLKEGTWSLAPAKQNVDPWCIAAAYVRLGYIPPLILADQFTATPDLTPLEAERVASAVREVTRLQQKRLDCIERILKQAETLRCW